MLTESGEERLRRYFYGESGDKFVLMNMDKMRKKFPDISWTDMKEWYENQELVQVMRPPPMIMKDERTGQAYKPIIAWYPFQRLYLDTMFIKPLKLTIVCGLDLYSRYAFAMPFYDSDIDSKKALSALRAFMEETKELGYGLKGYGGVWTDDGSEFKGLFKGFLKDEGLEHVVSKVGDSRKNRNIERFNKTLRLLIEKWSQLYGKKVDSKAIRKLIDGYNHTEHSSLDGLTPYEALKDMKLSRKLYNHYADLRIGNADKPELERLKNGTWVRWYIRYDDKFKKTGKNWSSTLFQISSYDPHSKTYTLDGLKNKHLRRDFLFVADKEKLERYNYKPVRSVGVERERHIGMTRDIKDVLRGEVVEGKRVRKTKGLVATELEKALVVGGTEDERRKQLEKYSKEMIRAIGRARGLAHKIRYYDKGKKHAYRSKPEIIDLILEDEF